MRARVILPPIPSKAVTLVGSGANSLRTFIIAANPLRRELGFDRGFDEWLFSTDSQMAKNQKKDGNLDPDNSLYLFYIHLIGPHHPLRPSVESRQRWNVTQIVQQKTGPFLKILKPDDAHGIAIIQRTTQW